MHTVLHQPRRNNLPNWKFSSLAEVTGQKVICNFRVADIALGQVLSSRGSIYLANIVPVEFRLCNIAS